MTHKTKAQRRAYRLLRRISYFDKRWKKAPPKHTIKLVWAYDGDGKSLGFFHDIPDGYGGDSHEIECNGRKSEIVNDIVFGVFFDEYLVGMCARKKRAVLLAKRIKFYQTHRQSQFQFVRGGDEWMHDCVNYLEEDELLAAMTVKSIKIGWCNTNNEEYKGC